MMYYDIIKFRYLVGKLDIIRSYLFYYSIRMKVRKIPLMLLEKFKIVLRYRKINIREINNTSKMVVPLKKSIHYFKHEEPISIKKHISKKDYTKIIISNFIHESNCLLEFINYLDLAVNTTPNLYCSFIKKYSILCLLSYLSKII